MPVTIEKSAPYAPASTVIDVVTRYRHRGLPTPVTADTLTRIGVTDSLVTRTLQAVQILDLVDDQGNPTKFLEDIRTAAETEVKAKTVAWLNHAYAEILKIIDPAVDEEVKIRDAFRTFMPVGQQPRMVTLFLQLYKWADIRSDVGGAKKAERVLHQKIKLRTRPVQKSQSPIATPDTLHQFISSNQTHPALAGLLASLPKESNGWTKSKRDAFLKTFEAVLDFVFPIKSEKEIDNEALE